MAISPNVLAGLAAALQGGMKAYNVQSAEDEDKRRFDEQQQHQKALLARAISRDELDVQQAEDERKARQLDTATRIGLNFGGTEVGADTLRDVPEHLRSLIAKPVDRPIAQPESTSLQGYAELANPTGPSASGAMFAEQQEAKPAAKPGELFEIQTPNSEKVRLQQARDQAALTRAQLMGQGRSEDREAANQRFLMGLAQRQDLGQQQINATLASIASRDARAQAIPIVIQTVDAQGNPVTRVLPRSEAVGKDFSAKPTAEQVNRKDAQGKAAKIFDTIDRLSGRINVNEGIIAKATGGAEKLKAQANLNDDVAGYEAMISGFTPLIARAVGHVGVLTEQDVQSVRALFPAVGDSKSLRDRKIAQIRYLMGNGPMLAGVDDPNKSFTDILNMNNVKPMSDAPIVSGAGVPAAAPSKFRITKVQ